MLNKSDNHYCLRYQKHNPTSDTMAMSMQLLVTEGNGKKNRKSTICQNTNSCHCSTVHFKMLWQQQTMGNLN